MAEFWSNNDRGYRIRLTIDQLSQNTLANSSQVRVRLALLNTTTTFAQYSCSAYVDLNGQRLDWSGSPSVLSYNSTISLIDRTITVNHNADGTKSFGFVASFSGSGGWSPGTLTIGSGTFTLTTIPRSSAITVTDGIIGNSISISIVRQNSSYTHTLRYGWFAKTGTIATNVTDSYTWTIPLSFANDIPNSTSGIGTIYVDTYNGSTLTGTQQVPFTATVPDSMKPTLSSINLTDAHTVAGSVVSSADYFVQVYSDIKVNFGSASGSYGSTIKSYYAEIVGKGQSTNQNGGTLGSMLYDGQITIRAKVIDSRGRESSTIDKTVTVLKYFPPALSFDVARSGYSSNTLTVTRRAAIAPLSVYGTQKNTMTLSFSVAELGSSYFSSNNGSASGTWANVSSLTNSAANLYGTFSPTKSYTVKGVLSDKFSRTEFTFDVGTESVVKSIAKDGIGIQKIWEKGALDVKGDTYISGKLYVNNTEVKPSFDKTEILNMVYPVGAIYMSTSSANPSTFIGGTWQRYAQGRTIVGVSENETEFNYAGKTGGEKTHQLTKAEMPRHDHNVSNDNNALLLAASSTKAYATAGAGSGSNSWPWQKGVQAEGGNQPHNNLQPYITTYIWLRTA
ncbi:capsid and scaffold protein [Streptococcus phage Javan149]|nr:capsid and scaffold protein [Streptococcus phage Javan149]